MGWGSNKRNVRYPCPPTMFRNVRSLVPSVFFFCSTPFKNFSAWTWSPVVVCWWVGIFSSLVVCGISLHRPPPWENRHRVVENRWNLIASAEGLWRTPGIACCFVSLESSFWYTIYVTDFLDCLISVPFVREFMVGTIWRRMLIFFTVVRGLITSSKLLVLCCICRFENVESSLYYNVRYLRFELLY